MKIITWCAMSMGFFRGTVAELGNWNRNGCLYLVCRLLVIVLEGEFVLRNNYYIAVPTLEY